MGKEYMRWIILVALILAGIACAIHDDVEIQGTPNSNQSEPVQNGTAKGIKILLIGSSYFNYNQLDQILTEFCSGNIFSIPPLKLISKMLSRSFTFITSLSKSVFSDLLF